METNTVLRKGMGEMEVVKRPTVDMVDREASLRKWYFTRSLKNEKEPAM